MRTSRNFTFFIFFLFAALSLSNGMDAQAQSSPFPWDGVVNDQKAGSVLFFNVYTSGVAGPISEDTRINITNTSSTKSVAVHIFFIDGETCSPADYVICMTQNQTYSFLASAFDPGTEGYIVAVAIDGNGFPIKHNYLIGDEYVRFSSGHSGSLGAEAVAAQWIEEAYETDFMFDLKFNGDQYDLLPSVLAIDGIPSINDGNDTMIILNRPTGDFAFGSDPIGTISGLLFNEVEVSHSFSFKSDQCQYKFSLTNSFPRTVPRIGNVIPTGTTGWMKLYSLTGCALLGAVFNSNSQPGLPTSFNGGRNLTALRLAKAVISIPVFPVNCR